MGPVSRLRGPWVPEPQLWQDPVPAHEGALIDDADAAKLKAAVLDSGLGVEELVATAWASAASYRSTDKRGGDKQNAESRPDRHQRAAQHSRALAINSWPKRSLIRSSEASVVAPRMP